MVMNDFHCLPRVYCEVMFMHQSVRLSISSLYSFSLLSIRCLKSLINTCRVLLRPKSSSLVTSLLGMMMSIQWKVSSQMTPTGLGRHKCHIKQYRTNNDIFVKISYIPGKDREIKSPKKTEQGRDIGWSQKKKKNKSKTNICAYQTKLMGSYKQLKSWCHSKPSWTGWIWWWDRDIEEIKNVPLALFSFTRRNMQQ